jgi:hypothetical protein
VRLYGEVRYNTLDIGDLFAPVAQIHRVYFKLVQFANAVVLNGVDRLSPCRRRALAVETSRSPKRRGGGGTPMPHDGALSGLPSLAMISRKWENLGADRLKSALKRVNDSCNNVLARQERLGDHCDEALEARMLRRRVKL